MAFAIQVNVLRAASSGLAIPVGFKAKPLGRPSGRLNQGLIFKPARLAREPPAARRPSLSHSPLAPESPPGDSSQRPPPSAWLGRPQHDQPSSPRMGRVPSALVLALSNAIPGKAAPWSFRELTHDPPPLPCARLVRPRHGPPPPSLELPKAQHPRPTTSRGWAGRNTTRPPRPAGWGGGLLPTRSGRSMNPPPPGSLRMFPLELSKAPP